MAPILRGAPLGGENERAIFAFFTGRKGIIRFTPENIDVSFHDLIRGNPRSITIEMEGRHEQKKKNAVYVCACVVLLRHRGYRGGDISKIQRR
jgi:hypothetical protein